MDAEEIINSPFEDGDFDEDTAVYRTYRMDFENKRIIGKVDGIDAAMQSIRKALETRRFAHLIYDDQYGCDILNKIGDEDLSDEYLDSDIPVMIEDALLPDDMVIGIGEMNFSIIDRDSVHVKFEAQTIFGDMDVEGVINDA